MQNNKSLALFDFDGTITTGDSLIGFLPHMVGFPRFVLGLFLLSPLLLAYLLKLIPNYKAKEKAFIHFFKNWDKTKFHEKAASYSRESLPRQVKASALEKIKWHQAQGHRVILISASMEAWLKPWCDSIGIECIATLLETQQGKITGRFLTKNCYGQEKVNRLKNHVDLTEYTEIYAYGDSRGDREMLELAGHSFYKLFRS
ncbi:MAG: HAD-IB family hydrolase [Spirochaetales bacterium]|nr:HAD-IB family hydrolase [Spirochaetales bacterium]